MTSHGCVYCDKGCHYCDAPAFWEVFGGLHFHTCNRHLGWACREVSKQVATVCVRPL